MVSHLLVALGLATGVACRGGEGAASFDAGSFDSFDAGFSPNPSAQIELRTIELSSGSRVSVFAPADAFDGLPKSPTAEQLCEDFAVSLTVIFDEAQQPTSYALSGAWRGLEGTNDSSLKQGLGGFIAQAFPGYEIPTQAGLGSVESNPIGLAPVSLSPTPSGSEPVADALAVYHYRTRAPMAVFDYSGQGPVPGFPAHWESAQIQTNVPAEPVWSRFIEGVGYLQNCDGYAEVLASAMTLEVIEELSSCGVLMSWPFSLHDPESAGDIFYGCSASSKGFGVTISPLTDNPWGVIDCPRPPEAQFEYVCSSQSGA